MRRNILGLKDAKKRPPPAEKRDTGGKVRRPTDLTASDKDERGTTPKPDAARTTERNPGMSGRQQQSQPGASPFWNAARQVHATAAQHRPRGMLERRKEAYEMPAALGEIAAGLRLLAQTHVGREPLEPAYAAAVMQIAATVESAAQASRHLAPAFDALHSVKVGRLLRPKPGEDMWDTVNNKP